MTPEQRQLVTTLIENAAAQNATSLDLSVAALKFPIGDEGVAILAHFSTRLRSLEVLDLGVGSMPTGSHWIDKQSYSQLLGFGNLGMAMGRLNRRSDPPSQDLMTDMRSLMLSSAGIDLLTQAAQCWPQLTALGLSHNNFGSDGFSKLASVASCWPLLKTLDLSGLQINNFGISALARAIRHWPSLTILNLALNNLRPADMTHLRKIIHHLKTLMVLSISCNKVGDGMIDVLNELATRQNTLVELDLQGTDLSTTVARAITPAMANSLSLRSLDLGHNALDASDVAIFADAFATLTELRTLNLSCNNIGDQGVLSIVQAFPKSCKLEELFLADVSLTSVGVEAIAAQASRLCKLQTLDISCNNIQDKGVELLLSTVCKEPWRSNLQTIVVEGNAVEFAPRELLDMRDVPTWISHAESVAREGSRPLYAAKLLLLGESGNGKTHLRRRLFEGEAQYYCASHELTHDIETAAWEVKAEIKDKQTRVFVRAWDFGGHSHLHASHRFFLSSTRSVYVVACDATKSREANRLDYWLRMIKHEASVRSPIVVAVTKCDLCIAGEHERVSKRLEALDPDELRRTNGFPDDTPIEVVDGLGWCPPPDVGPDDSKHFDRRDRTIDALQKAIQMVMPQVPGLNNKYTPTQIAAVQWFRWSAYNGESEKYVTMSRFQQAAQELGLGEQLRPMVLEIVSNIGLTHWVGGAKGPVGEERLKRLMFNPEWVKGPVYALLWSDSRSHNGVISREDIHAILPERTGDPNGISLWQRNSFTADDRELVVALMVERGLIYPLQRRKGQARFIVPDYLKATIKSGPPEGAYTWQRDFEWLHEADFGQLIVRLLQDSDEDADAIRRNEITLRVNDDTRVTIRHVVPHEQGAVANKWFAGSRVYIAVHGCNSTQAQRQMELVAVRLADILGESVSKISEWMLLAVPALRANTAEQATATSATKLRHSTLPVLTQPCNKKQNPDYMHAREYWDTAFQWFGARQVQIETWDDLYHRLKNGEVDLIDSKEFEKRFPNAGKFQRYCTDRGHDDKGRRAWWSLKGKRKSALSAVNPFGSDPRAKGFGGEEERE